MTYPFLASGDKLRAGDMTQQWQSGPAQLFFNPKGVIWGYEVSQALTTLGSPYTVDFSGCGSPSIGSAVYYLNVGSSSSEITSPYPPGSIVNELTSSQYGSLWVDDSTKITGSNSAAAAPVNGAVMFMHEHYLPTGTSWAWFYMTGKVLDRGGAADSSARCEIDVWDFTSGAWLQAASTSNDANSFSISGIARGARYISGGLARWCVLFQNEVQASGVLFDHNYSKVIAGSSLDADQFVINSGACIANGRFYETTGTTTFSIGSPSGTGGQAYWWHSMAVTSGASVIDIGSVTLGSKYAESEEGCYYKMDFSGASNPSTATGTLWFHNSAANPVTTGASMTEFTNGGYGSCWAQGAPEVNITGASPNYIQVRGKFNVDVAGSVIEDIIVYLPNTTGQSTIRGYVFNYRLGKWERNDLQGGVRCSNWRDYVSGVAGVDGSGGELYFLLVSTSGQTIDVDYPHLRVSRKCKEEAYHEVKILDVLSLNDSVVLSSQVFDQRSYATEDLWRKNGMFKRYECATSSNAVATSGTSPNFYVDFNNYSSDTAARRTGFITQAGVNFVGDLNLSNIEPFLYASYSGVAPMVGGSIINNMHAANAAAGDVAMAGVDIKTPFVGGFRTYAVHISTSAKIAGTFIEMLIPSGATTSYANKA